MVVPSSGVLCAGNDETVEHLFMACDYSKAIWLHFASSLLVNPPTTCLRQAMEFISSPGHRLDARKIVILKLH
ncbi:unnamed protein product [Cochlearia groenlandica]